MRKAARYSAAPARARSAPSPSALLTAIMSASSTMPFLMPCSSSPAPGSIRTRKKSVRSATAISDCPTPIVSTRTMSKPAASHSSMASRVRAATPPSVPDEGDGRIKAFGSAASRPMRVLSPRMAPPVRVELGSTASTATLCPCAVRLLPSVSMSVDLPTPGTPVMPTRTPPPVRSATLSRRRRDAARSSGRFDSISVMARARAARSPRSKASRSDAARARVIAGVMAACIAGVRARRRGGAPGMRRRSFGPAAGSAGAVTQA